MKIYLASSWRNEFQPAIVARLRRDGFDVYDFRNPPKSPPFRSWSLVSTNWQSWTKQDYLQALRHPIAVEAYYSDFSAMKQADVCVLLLPSGCSAHVEAGYMKGKGKPVYVLDLDEKPATELMYKLFNGIFLNYDDLKRRLEAYSGKALYRANVHERTPDVISCRYGHFTSDEEAIKFFRDNETNPDVDSIVVYRHRDEDTCGTVDYLTTINL